VDHALYAHRVEKNHIRNIDSIAGLPEGEQRYYNRWRRLPLGQGHLFYLLSLPVLTFGYIILFLPWSAQNVRYLVAVPYVIIVGVAYVSLWAWTAPMRGHINEYRGTIDGVADQVLKVVPAAKVVKDRLSEDRLVIDVQEGSMLVGLFNWPVGSDCVYVHIHPGSKADERLLRQLMDKLDRSLAD